MSNLVPNVDMMVPNASPPPASGISINTTPILGGTTTRFLYDNAGAVGETNSMTWDSVNQAITLTGYAKLSSIQLVYNALQVTGPGSLYIDSGGLIKTHNGDRWIFSGIDVGGRYCFFSNTGGEPCVVFDHNSPNNGDSVCTILFNGPVAGSVAGIGCQGPCTADIQFLSYNTHANGSAKHICQGSGTGGFLATQYNNLSGNIWETGVLTAGASTGDYFISYNSVFSYTSWAIRCPTAGGVVIGAAALATNATDGFLYIPSCAGAPSGAPTAHTGTVAMVYDTTDHKLYIYDTNGNTWRGGTVPGVWS
jgi:hypothetical protein